MPIYIYVTDNNYEMGATMKLTKLSSLSFLLYALSGCALIPNAGPRDGSIQHNAEISIKVEENDVNQYQNLRYALVDVTAPLMPYLLHEASKAKAYEWPEFMAPEDIKINVGDQLQITIYEALAGGLFVPKEAGVRPGNFITLPSQVVDASGKITIPYAGQVPVVGRSPAQIEEVIVERLKNRALDPQVVVTFGERGGSEISVIGRVNSARRYALNFNGERILDAIARAGGPVSQGFDTHVTLQRDGQERTIPFDALVQDPRKNIYLKPNDTVYLYEEPKTYMVFGAAGITGRYRFEQRELWLSEALGKAGGLRSAQADPAEMYVFRRERKTSLKKLMPSLKAEKWEQLEDVVPTIYKLNLREAGGFFLTQQFPVRNGDVIYVADAATVELQKFLAILSPGTSTALDTRELSE
jgi:polysaccharide export outer membrane protein